MSHPINDPTVDLPSIQVGEIWENPDIRERAAVAGHARVVAVESV